MVATIISPNFGYVLGVTAASFGIHHIYAALKVGAARKKYGVKYPHMYADKDNCPNEVNRNAFNCVQRAHQNCLENQPIFLAMLYGAGWKFPITAAVAGAIYLVGKILYVEGYSTGNPNKRMNGSVGYIGLFTLLGAMCRAAFLLLASK